MIWDLLRIAAAVLVAVVLYLVGAGIVRNMASADPPPDEPDLDALEDVDYRYQCIVCGAQAVLYAAPGGEVPEAPRHCREPMMLITPPA
ncbi:MAG: hypothetical protein M5T61_06545 [Acidimicrobiia bacterium]|nr:hypothetical protein [Acidimicrobiia bacterium]